MINNEELKTALGMCARDEKCDTCPYRKKWNCTNRVMLDTLCLINQYEEYIKQLEKNKENLAISYANAIAKNLTLKEKIEQLEFIEKVYLRGGEII